MTAIVTSGCGRRPPAKPDGQPVMYADDGLATFERIEAFGDDGSNRLIERAEFERLCEPLEEAYQKARSQREAIPVVAKVIIQSFLLNDAQGWVEYSTFTDRAKAQEAYDELAPHLGERVRLVDLP